MLPSNAQIEQLWFTSAVTGLGAVRGYRVRAASPGLRDVSSAEVRAMIPFMRYSLPKGFDETTKPESTPVSLSLIQLQTERVIINKRYAGLDYTGRRYGNFFAHLLAKLPNNWTAREAIELWSCEYWKYEAVLGKDQVDLENPTLAKLKTGPLSPQELAKHDMVQKHLAYVIQAVLTMKPKQRLYIAAPPDVVAALIWGATHALPKVFLRPLTFSTYEQDVTQATLDIKGDQIQIIGTCWSAEEVKRGKVDLPPVCYQGGNLGLNCYLSDRFTPLQKTERESAVAQETIRLLFEHKTELDAILKACDAGIWGRDDFFQLLEINSKCVNLKKLDLAEGKEPPTQELFPRRELFVQLLKKKMLGLEWLARPDVSEALYQLILLQPEWWNNSPEIKTSLKNYQTNPNMFSKLREELLIQAKDAFQNNRIQAGKQIITSLATFYDALEGVPPVKELLNVLQKDLGARPAKSYPWAFRSWFLMELHRASLSVDQVSPWLSATWGELAHLLNLGLHDTWEQKAIGVVLAENDSSAAFPSNLSELVINHNSLFDREIAIALNEDQSRLAVARLFRELVRQNYQNSGDLLNKLIYLGTEQLDTVKQIDFNERLLEATWSLTQNSFWSPQSMTKFLEMHCSQLVQNLDRRPNLLKLLNLYLQNLSWYQIDWPDTRQLLDCVERERDNLESTLRLLATSWIALAQLKRSFSPETAKSINLKQAIENLPKNQREQTIQNLLSDLCYRNAYDIQELGRVLYTFSDSFGMTVAELYDIILDKTRHQYSDVTRLIAFVQLAFLIPRELRETLGDNDFDQVSCRSHLAAAVQEMDNFTIDGITKVIIPIQGHFVPEWEGFIEANRRKGWFQQSVAKLTGQQTNDFQSHSFAQLSPSESVGQVTGEESSEIFVNSGESEYTNPGGVASKPNGLSFSYYPLGENETLHDIVERIGGMELTYLVSDETGRNPNPNKLKPGDKLRVPLLRPGYQLYLVKKGQTVSDIRKARDLIERREHEIKRVDDKDIFAFPPKAGELVWVPKKEFIGQPRPKEQS